MVSPKWNVSNTLRDSYTLFGNSTYCKFYDRVLTTPYLIWLLQSANYNQDIELASHDHYQVLALTLYTWCHPINKSQLLIQAQLRTFRASQIDANSLNTDTHASYYDCLPSTPSRHDELFIKSFAWTWPYLPRVYARAIFVIRC